MVPIENRLTDNHVIEIISFTGYRTCLILDSIHSCNFSSPTPLDSSGTSRGAYDVSYGPEEAESTAAALGNCFRLVQPGSHVIKRSGRGCDHNDIRFIHRSEGVRFSPLLV